MRLKVIGPPGTGKTTKILKLVHDYDRRDDIKKIVCCSFTVKAKLETEQRMIAQGLQVNTYQKTCHKIYVRTIHGLAFEHMKYKKTYMINTLARFARSIGQSSRIYDDRNTMSAKTPLEKSIAHYHLQRSLMYGHVPLPAGLDIYTVQGFIQKFEDYKLENALLDYNDVLINYLNEGAPLDYQIALVDEAQDLSPLQWSTIHKMFGACIDVIYAGDDDQTIFNFAGVKAKDFIDLEVDETIVLDQSYRFGAGIFDHSQHVVGRIQHRTDKTFKPTKDNSVVTHTNSIVPELDILPFDSVAILHRNTYLFKRTRELLDSKGLTYSGKGSAYNIRTPLTAIQYWERWRSGEQMSAGQVHLIMKYVPTDITCDRMEDQGRKSLAPPCPFPDKPWYEILVVQNREKFMKVQNLRGLTYLTAKPMIEVTTIHQAKGGEWDKVIIVPDMSTATWKDYKSEANSDAEHRVWYVAITRAKKALQIIRPRTNKFYPLD